MRLLIQIFLIPMALWGVTVSGCGGTSSNAEDSETGDTPSATDSTTDAWDSTRDTTTDSETVDTDSELVDTTVNDTTSNADSEAEAPPLWGWISAIEWNDTCDQWYEISDWTGGVRAYFAETASYPRALLHTLDFIPETAAEGSCRLYNAGIISNCEYHACFACVDAIFECWLNCGQDQECRGDDDSGIGVCVDLPDHRDLGKITLAGFKEPITLTPDEYDRYYTASDLADPNDLFDDDDTLTATTEGGVLEPLSFTTKGVAPLELPSAVVEISADTPAVVRWTPADDDSRIQIALTGGSHDPNPLTAQILCDVPDSDGILEIPKSIVNAFLAESCEEAWLKCSRITRYTRDVKQLDGKELELFVGSARKLQIVVDSPPTMNDTYGGVAR